MRVFESIIWLNENFICTYDQDFSYRIFWRKNLWRTGHVIGRFWSKIPQSWFLYHVYQRKQEPHFFFQTWYEQQKSFFRLLIGSSVTVESFWVNARSVSLFRFEEILKKIQVVELTLITFFCHNSKSGVLLSRHKPKEHIIFDTFFTEFTKLKKTPY